MSNPINAAFDVREDLSVTIEEFNHEMNRAGYVGHRLLPATPKQLKSGKMPRIPLEQTMQDVDVDRNPDGSFKVISMEWSDDLYDTQSKGLEAPVDDETLERYDDIFDAEASLAMMLHETILRSFEISVVSFLTNPANYDPSRVIGGLSDWRNKASATCYVDVDAQREAMFLELGQEPNALILSRTDMRSALQSDRILDNSRNQNFQDVRPGVLNANSANFALALDVPEVIAANSLANTGQQRNLSRIWPVGYAVLAKISETDDEAEVALGRSPVWSPMGIVEGDGRIGVWGESYDKPEIAGSQIRKRANWGRKIYHVEAARLLKIHGQA